MTARIDEFLTKFEAFGYEPSAERYLALFHPDATLMDAGLAQPLTLAEIPQNIALVLQAMPDFRFAIERWRAGPESLFVEAANSGTLGGEALRWGSVYCVSLEGDQVIRGRRYYDRGQVVGRLMPDLKPLPVYEPVTDPGLEPPKPFPSLGDWVEQYTALWQSADPQRFADFYREDGVILNPGMDRPVARGEIPGYYQLLLAVAPDLRQNRVSWAGDDTLLYIEWQATGSIAGRPLRLPVVDRWLLDGGLATEGIAFFDSITLSQALYGDA